jgi:glycosyltransferase involved in cell wall biosynthesis
MTSNSIDRSATRLINLSELSPQWQWLRDAFKDEIPDWHHVTTLDMQTRLPVARAKEARWRAVQAAKELFRQHSGRRILVSHGPRPASYWGAFASRVPLDSHDVYSFNFTDLPSGVARRSLALAFRSVDEFVVASTWERELYSEYLDIPISKIRFQHWGVASPDSDNAGSTPIVEGDYICAIGSQARDYALLCEAMRLRPDIKLVIVGIPASMRDVAVPANVEFRTNIPLADAMNIMKFSRLMALPMNSMEARCGHVTAVSALHLGVPIVATRCKGLDDYLRDDETALLAEHADPASLAAAIDRLFSDASLRSAIAVRAASFAQQHCTEAAAIDSYRNSLRARSLLE